MEGEKIFVQTHDKVIISDLLFSVYNGFTNLPRQMVVETNSKFYDESTIWNEKVRLFEAIGKKVNQRRQTEKSDPKTKNIEDILTEIETRDASGAFLPVFVAVRLHNIPLSQDGAVTNAQILGNIKSLKKDLLSLRFSSSYLPDVRPSSVPQPASPRTPGRRLPPCPIAISTLAGGASRRVSSTVLRCLVSSVNGAKSIHSYAQFIVGGAQFIVGVAQSIVGGAQSIVGGAQSIVGEAQSIVGGVQSIVGGAQSTVGGDPSIVGGAQSYVGDAQSIGAVGGAKSII